MWLLTAAVIWFGLERLVLRWLRYLERITSLYAEGRRGVRPERIVAAPAEIRSLGETFSRMADLIDVHETELRDSLEQKEMLVREVHHRVKNNLQLVMSLLSLHGRRVRDPHAELAFMEVRERITALATLHRRLYESETLDSVDLRWFLEDLCAELRKGGAPGSRAVRLETDIDSVEFSAGAAVPLGLLVTEAISNAYKHAFRDESSGSIRLTAHRLEGEMLVSVADDGVGGRPGTGEPDESGLGRSLMESFAKQLGGTLEVETTTEGTRVGVRFPMATAKEAA
jgi:two-component sensor histidine kinase